MTLAERVERPRRMASSAAATPRRSPSPVPDAVRSSGPCSTLHSYDLSAARRRHAFRADQRSPPGDLERAPRRPRAARRRLRDAAGFEPAPAGTCCCRARRRLGGVLFGLEAAGQAGQGSVAAGRAAGVLPAGAYRFANAPHDPRLAALAFALGAYRFARYRKPTKEVRLEVPTASTAPSSRASSKASISRAISSIRRQTTWARPSSRMRPARSPPARRDARAIVGDDLDRANFPLIHAVGRAADRAPRLIDIQLGRRRRPKVTLIGKGVCFDTGGLDIKPDSGMLL